MILNADDLGMTPGANRAIFEGHDRGAVTHTSVMANGDYFDDAMEGMASRPKLGLGMHLNLTYGKALLEHPLYCDERGVFKLGYGALLRYRDPAFLDVVKKEFEAQILRVRERIEEGRELTHIDSHRHIHLIPHLYRIVIDLARTYRIPRVRLIREDLFTSIRMTGSLDFFLNGGIVKYALLRSFTHLDARYEDRYEGLRFYSILYTGIVGAKVLERIASRREAYEVMVHPGDPELDRQIDFYDPAERAYRISDDRSRELEAVCSLPRQA
jgi:predicted glycoside hydrolase/deacetylase ChbG (UPF0249 family)